MLHFGPLLGPHLGSLWRLNRVKKGALKARGLQTPQKSTHVHTRVPKRDPKRLLVDRFLETVLQKINALPVHLLRQVSVLMTFRESVCVCVWHLVHLSSLDLELRRCQQLTSIEAGFFAVLYFCDASPA